MQRKLGLSWVIRTALTGKSKLATGSFKGDCGNAQNLSWDVERRDYRQEKAVAKEERGGTSTGKWRGWRIKGADHTQAGCWSLCLSGQALCLITAVCSIFLSNSVCIHCASLLSILGKCARSTSKIQVGLASK